MASRPRKQHGGSFSSVRTMLPRPEASPRVAALSRKVRQPTGRHSAVRERFVGGRRGYPQLRDHSSIVLLSSVLDFAQESRAQVAVDALQAKVALRARVVRAGQDLMVPVTELVPGDVVRLSAGDLVPADGRLTAAKDFFVNEALLTGESYPVEKHATSAPGTAADLIHADGAALAGTSVISGSATLLVCATGRHTILGQLADTLIARPPPNSFEIGLRRFSYLLLRITVLLVLVVLTESLWFQRGWFESVMFAIALAVGLTPELLPMVVTVTSRGAIRMAKERVIVKRLSAVHDLGSMDVLCTDKTGTLTEAAIRLEQHLDAAGQRQRARARAGGAQQQARDRPQDAHG